MDTFENNLKDDIVKLFDKNMFIKLKTDATIDNIYKYAYAPYMVFFVKDILGNIKHLMYMKVLICG